MYFILPDQFRNVSHPYRHLDHKTAWTMTVEGEGQITAKPNQAKIHLGVSTENPNVQQAQHENTLLSNQIIDALKRSGIGESDIKTVTYSIFPRYDYIEGKSILKSYEVEHLFEITVKDLTKTGMVYDTAIQNGANRSGSIQFLVSNPGEYYQKALAMAMIDAGKKATVLSQTLGVILHPIPIKIIESGKQQDRQSRPYQFQTTVASAKDSPPIEEGLYTIRATVTAVYSYRSSKTRKPTQGVAYL